MIFNKQSLSPLNKSTPVDLTYRSNENLTLQDESMANRVFPIRLNKHHNRRFKSRPV